MPGSVPDPGDSTVNETEGSLLPPDPHSGEGRKWGKCIHLLGL